MKKKRSPRIHPIKTAADYRAALEQIERLFDAAPGTPDGTA
jgi:antitoxin component HigA of HigAB toxin-antitoxin module